MRVSLLDDECWLDRTWPPEPLGTDGAASASLEHLRASLYELPPGESTFAYHYELAQSWLAAVTQSSIT